MKAALPVLVAAALSAAAGGVIGALLAREGGGPSVADPAAAARVQRLDERVASVHDEVSEVSGRLRQVELALLAGAADDGGHDAPEPLAAAAVPVAAPGSGDDVLAAFLAGGDSEADQVLTERVAEVVADLRAAEERERDERREQARQEMFEERLQRLTTDLGLDAYQQDRMRAALTAEEQKREEVFDGVRENGGWSGMRDALREVSAATEKDLETFLTPSQLEQYDEQDRGFFGRGFGGPGGPGG